MIFLTGGVRDDGESVYVGILWVFSNISGLVTMLPDGTINSINENFALMLFGYSRADLIGKVCKTKFKKIFLKLSSISSVCNGYTDSTCILYFGAGYLDLDPRFL